MKKLISIVLSLAMCLTLCAPAFAADADKKDTALSTLSMSADGQSLSFDLQEVDNGEYELKFYMNGELIRIHTIAPGRTIETLDCKTKKVSTMDIPSCEVATVEDNVTRAPVRWTHLGYMHFKYSSVYDCESAAAVSCRATDSYASTYSVNTGVSRTVDSAVTLVVGVILSELIAPYIAAAGALAAAQAIVAAMIVENNASVIGDTISGIFVDSYDCTVTDYMISTQVVGTGISSSEKVTYEGVLYTVDYGNESYATEAADNDYYTPETWKHPMFARYIWNDSLPGSPTFPGIYTTYPYSYPL